MHHDTYSCCRDVGKQRWCSNCCGIEFIIAVSVCYIVMWNVKKNTELKDMKNCSKDMKICKNWKKDKQIYQKDQQIRKLQEEMKNHAAKKAHKKFYGDKRMNFPPSPGCSFTYTTKQDSSSSVASWYGVMSCGEFLRMRWTAS